MVAYRVQVMLGFGRPSTKHSNDTLVSGPAITFFTSSLICTVGGAAVGDILLNEVTKIERKMK